MSSNEKPEGWVAMSNVRKSHYVRNGRSLCGRWAYFGSVYDSRGFHGLENCATCEKKRAAEPKD